MFVLYCVGCMLFSFGGNKELYSYNLYYLNDKMNETWIYDVIGFGAWFTVLPMTLQNDFLTETLTETLDFLKQIITLKSFSKMWFIHLKIGHHTDSSVGQFKKAPLFLNMIHGPH